jgi:hypothetical protein
VVVAGPKEPIHPALLELREERARSVQDRVADAIPGSRDGCGSPISTSPGSRSGSRRGSSDTRTGCWP